MKSWFLHHVSIPEVFAERIAGFHRTPTTRHRRSFLSPLDPIIDVVRIASRLTLAGPSPRLPKTIAVPASCESTGAEGASTVSFGSCGLFMARSSVSLKVCCPRISAEAIEFEASGADHELHFIDASDDVCKRQLKERSKGLPAGTAWTTDAEFDAITAYFEPPSIEEHFNIIRHERV
jgi:hypothetical protein